MSDKLDRMTDEALVQLAQHGDHSAEEKVLDRYKDLVRARAHIYFIAGADSEDVIQEGMIGLFRAVKYYDPSRNASFRTFAGLCVTRQIVTAIKSARRLKNIPLNSSISLDLPAGDKDDSETIQNVISGTSVSPEDIMLAKDIAESIIVKTPRFLSRFEQQVWSLYLEGKDYTEIAYETGKSNKSVDNAIQRIKKKVERYVLG